MISIPLEFASGSNQTVGTIQAELNVKEGPWRFEKAKPPEDSSGTISATPRRSVENGRFLIELEISGGDQGIDDGLAGYLLFSTNDSSASEIPIVTVGRLDTFPPNGLGAGPQSAGGAELPPAPDGATISPSCFFFTH